MHRRQAAVAWIGFGLILCGSTYACSPAAAPTPTAAADPFAVVRATSEAAYTRGRDELQRGEFLQACVDLDTAVTNDPDQRAEIRDALQQALQRCLTPSAEPASSTPAAAAQPARTLVLPTVPVPAALTAGATSAAATAVPASRTAPAGATAASTPAAATPISSNSTNLVAWNDPQGRFVVSAPADWKPVQPPQSMFGSSVVEFRDPTNRAEFDVGVDSNTRAVSPELYAASMDVAMQQQLPGYATEQVQPGSTAGNPSVRRVFTFTQRDAAGQDHQARGFQVAVLKGQTAYIISGSAPAEQFQQFSPMFDQMVDSFRFS